MKHYQNRPSGLWSYDTHCIQEFELRSIERTKEGRKEETNQFGSEESIMRRKEHLYESIQSVNKKSIQKKNGGGSETRDNSLDVRRA